MINAISGILCHKGADTIRLENNGIEWELSVPARSVDAFGRLGEKARALCWLLHREDQMHLYGFPSEAERSVFVQLMGVEGIGPKQAIKILGGIGAAELELALDTEDLARLEAVPGLGKKTAQKLVFSLKGKLPSAFGDQARPAEQKHPFEDIVRALTELGYDRRRSGETVSAIAKELSAQPGAQDAEREIFRRAIVALSGS